MPGRKRIHDRDDEDLEVHQAPIQINPYETLNLNKEATQEEVKKAYRKAALLHHPDKVTNGDKEAAHVKFQEIAFAYAILSDERRRKRYDTTGRTEESLDLEDDDFDWSSFYREQFADAITEETIKQFMQQYTGSEEERNALLEAYTRFKGNMTKIYEVVMLSDPGEDDERFRAVLDAAIAEGKIEAFAKYTEESEKSRTNRIKRAKKLREDEAAEVAEAEEEIQQRKPAAKKTKTKTKDSEADLAALIQKRQMDRGQNFFDNLEAKYSQANGKGRKRASEEPPEEAFAANRNKGKRKSKA